MGREEATMTQCHRRGEIDGLDGSQSPSELADLKAHLEECPACRHAFETNQLVDGLLRETMQSNPVSLQWQDDTMELLRTVVQKPTIPLIVQNSPPSPAVATKTAWLGVLMTLAAILVVCFSVWKLLGRSYKMEIAKDPRAPISQRSEPAAITQHSTTVRPHEGFVAYLDPASDEDIDIIWILPVSTSHSQTNSIPKR
jgi:hypothetical protein